MLAAGMGFKSRPDRGVKGKRLRSLRRLKKTLDIEIGMQVYGRWLLFSQDRSGGLICASEKRRKAALWLSTEVPRGGVYRTALYSSAAGRRNHRTSLPLQLGISGNYPEPREILKKV
jgi:hypothetical protein